MFSSLYSSTSSETIVSDEFVRGKLAFVSNYGLHSYFQVNKATLDKAKQVANFTWSMALAHLQNSYFTTTNGVSLQAT